MTPEQGRQAVCVPLIRRHGDLWFSENRQDTERAKAYCRACPVQAACLADGLKEHDGVWGGTTAGRRRSLRPGRELAENACGTTAGYHRHTKAKEDPCQPCRDARNAAKRAERAATKAADEAARTGRVAPRRGGRPAAA